MSQNSLINKYRPQAFDQVVGNELVVKALQSAVLSDSRPHAYLLTGPSGIGKTTLARIVADSINAKLEECDAASNSGIDSMRSLVLSAGFTSISNRPNRAIFLDEVHALSKPAFQAILKLLEEPPSNIYIMLSTTETSKIPDNIKSRCYKVVLKPVKMQEMSDYVEVIADLEGWKLDNGVFQGIIQAATGQPRKALTLLQAGHACKNREELAELISGVTSENCPITGLLSYLLKKGRDWKQINEFLGALEGEDDYAIQAENYLRAVILTGTEGQARNAWVILDALLFPRNTYDSKTKLIAAVGSLLWANQYN